MILQIDYGCPCAVGSGGGWLVARAMLPAAIGEEPWTFPHRLPGGWRGRRR